MKLPWATKEPEPVTAPPVITDEEITRRKAEWEERERILLERRARIPRDLAGYRLADGCTCGATAAAEAKFGIGYERMTSVGIRHEDDCEMLSGLWVQVIEV